jgi:hypothetical protein
MVLFVIVQTTGRGFRNVSQALRMPRLFHPSHAPLDPALVVFAQFGLADLKDLARADPEFANLVCDNRWHVLCPDGSRCFLNAHGQTLSKDVERLLNPGG